jgi:hypothetical protein
VLGGLLPIAVIVDRAVRSAQTSESATAFAPAAVTVNGLPLIAFDVPLWSKGVADMPLHSCSATPTAASLVPDTVGCAVTVNVPNAVVGTQ